jgi:enoyl-CoA hydratase
MNDTVEIQQQGAIRWLRLNRPERRNAINDELVAALGAAIESADADDTVRAVVIAGNGPSFCAGADLRHLLAISDQPGQPTAFLATVSGLVSRIERCSKPVIAALHGHVVAGGLEIALACDVVLAADGCLIGDGHVRNRLLPAAGSSVRLPRKVGEGLARRLLLGGQLLPATEFVRSGWIASVVTPDSLDEAAGVVAQQLAAVAGPAQTNLKRLLGELEDVGVGRGLELELEAFDANWTQADVPEALRAFLSPRDALKA